MSTQATGARVPPARIVGGAGIAFAASAAIQNAVVVGAVIDAGRDVAPDLWRRYLAIMLQGLRAQPAQLGPLPTPTVSPEQMDDVLMGARKVRRGNPADGEFG
jgi:hypothetical protein